MVFKELNVGMESYCLSQKTDASHWTPAQWGSVYVFMAWHLVKHR